MIPVLNYFVPFTNGKFVAQCLMFSDSVESAVDPVKQLEHENWNLVEYSDIDLWWKDHDHDWFNTPDWELFLTDRVSQSTKYVFYTCHEDYSVHHIKRLLPESRILTILPNPDLCKQNYINKNWVHTELSFEDSRVFNELQSFKPITQDIVIKQDDLFNETSFISCMEYLQKSLSISLDLDAVLQYREKYFMHRRNVFGSRLPQP